MDNRTTAFFATCGDYNVRFAPNGIASVSRNGNVILKNLSVYNCETGQPLSLEKPEVTYERPSMNAYNRFQRRTELRFAEAGVLLVCQLNDDEIQFLAEADDGKKLCWQADLYWGENMEQETFAVSTQQDAPVLRAAVGPATDKFTHALLNREDGQLLDFGTEAPVRLEYSFEKKCYQLKSCGTDFFVTVTEDFYKQQYGVRYQPVRKDGPTDGPLAGFCTYYAWLFDYDEDKLMDTVRVQREKLLNFGANCVLVDLEWVREDIVGNLNFPGDHFHPDTKRFPSGMKALVKKIEAEGFVPQLWVGFTNETHITDVMKEHPDIVISDETDDSWCGKYFLDPTHPYVKDVYIPKFLEQLKQWSLRCIKWDLLGETHTALEKYHDRLYDPEKTSTEIMRQTMEYVRKTLGENVYICQCGAPGENELRLGADVFDAMRIGRDLWHWEDFQKQMLYKLCTHYPLHNVMLYCDPDTLILAEHRITAEDTCIGDPTQRKGTSISRDEAISRLTPVVLLGQVFMLGEDVAQMSEERLDMVRKGLPVADVHPAKLGFTKKEPIMSTVVQVKQPFDSWTVFSMVNTLEETVVREVSLEKDLGLEAGDYLLYDFWEEKLVEQTDDRFVVTLRPRQTVNYRISRKQAVPQIVSSSRHMLQGAVELENVCWDETCATLALTCKTVPEYPYKISLFVPEGFKTEQLPMEYRPDLQGYVCVLTVPGSENGSYHAEIVFTKE